MIVLCALRQNHANSINFWCVYFYLTCTISNIKFPILVSMCNLFWLSSCSQSHYIYFLNVPCCYVQSTLPLKKSKCFPLIIWLLLSYKTFQTSSFFPLAFLNVTWTCYIIIFKSILICIDVFLLYILYGHCYYLFFFIMAWLLMFLFNVLVVHWNPSLDGSGSHSGKSLWWKGIALSRIC